MVEVADTAKTVAACRERNILISAAGPGVLRAVTHLDVTEQGALEAAAAIADCA
jgi:threonine aldolase